MPNLKDNRSRKLLFAAVAIIFLTTLWLTYEPQHSINNHTPLEKAERQQQEFRPHPTALTPHPNKETQTTPTPGKPATPRTTITYLTQTGDTVDASDVLLSAEHALNTTIEEGAHVITWTDTTPSSISIEALAPQGHGAAHLTYPFPENSRVTLSGLTISGTVRYADGSPCKSCSVWAQDTLGGPTSPGHVSASGTFAIGHLHADKAYTLHANHATRQVFVRGIGGAHLPGASGVPLSVSSLYGLSLRITGEGGSPVLADPRLASVGWTFLDEELPFDTVTHTEAVAKQLDLTFPNDETSTRFSVLVEGPGNETLNNTRIDLTYTLPGYTTYASILQIPRITNTSPIPEKEVRLESTARHRGNLSFSVVGLPWPSYDLAGTAFASVRLAHPEVPSLSQLFDPRVLGVGLTQFTLDSSEIIGLPEGPYRVGLLLHHFFDDAVPGIPALIEISHNAVSHVFFDLSHLGVITINIDRAGAAAGGQMDVVIRSTTNRSRRHRAQFLDAPYTLVGLPLEQFEIAPIRSGKMLPSKTIDVVPGEKVVTWDLP